MRIFPMSPVSDLIEIYSFLAYNLRLFKSVYLILDLNTGRGSTLPAVYIQSVAIALKCLLLRGTVMASTGNVGKSAVVATASKSAHQ